MSIFDNINQCLCGNEFQKDNIICSKCGRKKFKMSTLPDHEDSIDATMRNISKAVKYTKNILAFQLARTRGGR
jgi:hypothetical protein